MNKFGLSTKEKTEIIKIFKINPEVTEVLVYGSRARGDNKKASDIDLALKGNLNSELVSRIHYQLNETTPLPYFFDVLDYKKLTNKNLKKEIDIEGKLFYKKE